MTHQGMKSRICGNQLQENTHRKIEIFLGADVKPWKPRDITWIT